MFDKVLKEESEEEKCPVRVALYQVADMKDDVDENQPTSVPQMCCVMPAMELTSLQKDADELVGNEKLWVQGYKIFADGSPHSGTMAIREPFLRSNLTEILGFPPVPDSYGHQNYSWDEIYNTVKYYYVECGKQVAVHAYGERAIDRVMSVFEKVSSTNIIVKYITCTSLCFTTSSTTTGAPISRCDVRARPRVRAF